MHILIVDDEPLARMRLKRMLNDVPDVTMITQAENGERAIAQTLADDPDIIFMDIRMPGTDGLSAARTISAMDDPPAIIFCTAYDQYAVEAFETLAAGYLLKPVNQEKLHATLEKAAKTTKIQRSTFDPSQSAGLSASIRKHIAVNSRSGTELIQLSTITCFIADNKYVTIMHQKGESLIDETLKELEHEFSDRFVRVHRNALVAKHAIEALVKNKEGHAHIRLKHSDFSPQVSRRHMASVKAVLASI